ncbi:MAG: potassium-transporting ATPase subunit KdpC [Piscinibacter sp.]|nr:potassium-transporting ATPase subunit KdpC [Piscinibacter sp.]
MTMSTSTIAANSSQAGIDDGGAWRGAVALAVVAMALLGLGYSLLGMGLGRALFPAQAGGSLVERDGRVIGSVLVAQPFADARYFHPRPSAAGYDPMNVAGSNQARSNPALQERLQEARRQAALDNGVSPDAVPGDLVTQSGGGIDPHISPAAARLQVARVARARGLTEATVTTLVREHTEPPTFGLLGAERVNVLLLNLALDGLPTSR